MRKDIQNEADIKLLVDTFYDNVNRDTLLSSVFNDYAHINWAHHLPVMYKFWSSILFGTMAYRGQPFVKHVPLPITEEHFARWLQLFSQTVDSLFEGTTAQEAKQKATTIARVFQMKLGLTDAIPRQL